MLPAGRARPGEPAGGRRRPQILLPVVDELVEKLGGGVHGGSCAFDVLESVRNLSNDPALSSLSQALRCSVRWLSNGTKRAPVLDLSAPAALEVEIDVAEAAEVLMSICALGDRDDYDTFDLGEEWLRARLETVPPDLLAAVDELRLGYAEGRRAPARDRPRDAEAADLRAVPRAAARRPTRSSSSCTSSAATAATSPPLVARRDRARRARRRGGARRSSSPRSSSTRTSTSRRGRCSSSDGEELKARLLELLPRWYEHVFVPHEQEWREAAERDAEAKRELARYALAGAARRARDAWLPVRAGARASATLAFFPSWWMRPWVILWEHKGTKIFCYPIARRARGGRLAGRAGARLQGARRRGPAAAAAAPERGAAHARRGGHGARRREVDRAPPPRDPAPGRLRHGPRRGRERLQPPPRPAAAGGRAADRLPRLVEVLLDERVEHAVHPAVVAAYAFRLTPSRM